MIRHGQIAPNKKENANLLVGALNNKLTDLTEKGIEDARKLSKSQQIKQIEKIYCSDLRRATDTAKIIVNNRIPIQIEPLLRERSLGIFEGKKKPELLDSPEYKKYILEEKYNRFRGDFYQKAPQGESYTDVSKRCQKFLDTLDLDKEMTIGIVSHLHCIRCLFLNLLDIKPREKIFQLKIQNCEPYIIEGNLKEGFHLVSHDLEKLF